MNFAKFLKTIFSRRPKNCYFLKFLFIKGTLSRLRQFLTTESPLKMMKNAFYFTSKAVFVLKIFKFLSWLFGHISKQLDRKDKVNFKFQTIVIHILPNISRSKENQTMKFGQVIECNMRNIFSWKTIHKMWWRN